MCKFKCRFTKANFCIFRCSVCQTCGSNEPGFNSQWYDNYSLCGPCHSLSLCAACEEGYEDGELIIQCNTWYCCLLESVGMSRPLPRLIALIICICELEQNNSLKYQFIFDAFF